MFPIPLPSRAGTLRPVRAARRKLEITSARPINRALSGNDLPLPGSSAKFEEIYAGVGGRAERRLTPSG